MYSNSIMFNDFVEQHDVESLRGWLLSGLETLDFDPFYLGSASSPSVQLQHSFAELGLPLRERFKAATIRATSEWYSSGYKPETLKQLVLLAAYIRATGVIDVLRVHIESGALEELRRVPTEDETTDVYKDIVQYIVGVTQGFAPLPETKIILERLFFSNSFARFAAQLFLGLCECTPEQYTEYVPRFLELEALHPEYYSMSHVMHGLVRKVSLRTIAQNFYNLDAQWQERFLEFLCLYPWSPAKMVSSDRNTSTIEIVEKKALRDPSEPIQKLPLSFDHELMFQITSHANDEERMLEVLSQLDQETGSAVHFVKRILGT